MRLSILVCALAGILAVSARAADYVAPLSYPSTQLAGTIASTNTFQSIQKKNAARNGCSIQNQSSNSNTMWVYFDSANSSACSAASKAASFTLSPGQSISCNLGTIVLSDQVCITGTSGDGYAANFQ